MDEVIKDIKEEKEIEVETEAKTEVKEQQEIKKEKKNLFKKKEDLEKKKLEEDNKLLNDKILRISAEMQNMKRRNEERLTTMLKYEGEEVIKNLLPTIDNFERAISIDESVNTEEVNKFLSGFKMIYNNLKETLNSFQVKEIECLNKPFDPNIMEAVMVEENKSVEPDTVIEVLQKGYTYKDKVIRHAMVKVSK